jgi:uncharacterized membrane protein
LEQFGIYWNNHHHLLHATQHVTGGVLWANLHLLFWLSLTPFATDWMGESHFAPWTVALYGTVLLLAAIAYTILTKTLIAQHETNSMLAESIGSDRKGKLSVVVYINCASIVFATAKDRLRLISADGYCVVNPRSTNRKTTY